VAADVGTVDSGLNSMVLASNNEMVLLPVNEPTFGTKRKSQIQVRRATGAGEGRGGAGRGGAGRGGAGRGGAGRGGAGRGGRALPAGRRFQ
jgi:hypothetical protein